MEDKVTTLIRIDQIATGAAMAFALTEMRKYFVEAGWAQPPIPDNLTTFIPCALRCAMIAVAEWIFSER